MSYTLYTGQMLEALLEAEHIEAKRLRDKLFCLNAEIAETLAEHIGAKVRPDSPAEFFDGQYAAVFAPLHEGQALPEVIAGYDNAEEWEG